MITKPRATIDDLFEIDGKAELVNGEIVRMPPTGDEPGRSGGAVFVSLMAYERATGLGYAYPDNVGFRVNMPNRDSFSPDAAFFTGPRAGMGFLDGAPVFAVEVRSAGDYGPKAERDMADKRADYFAAGTQVVWDVDLRSEAPIRKYTAATQQEPVAYRRGEAANAEPALPGWQFSVNELFV